MIIYYAVKAGSDKERLFQFLDDALVFVRDQLEMNRSCTIEAIALLKHQQMAVDENDDLVIVEGQEAT